MKKNIKILIAAHKEYMMPNDDLYLPIHVGKGNSNSEIGYMGDNSGDNISEKNPYYSELTGLYWAWKNLEVDYLGLVHYRRYFALKKSMSKNPKDRMNSVLTLEQAKSILDEFDGIVPKKRNYYVETLYSHYENTLHVEPLEITGMIIKEKYPEYFESFEKLKVWREGYMFNMMILKKDDMNRYLKWLFEILSDLEFRVDNSRYSPFHARFYGRISELLFNVWLDLENLNLKEIPVIDIEPVNWLKKGTSFLKAKITSEKYEKSF
ncbi:exopolysaccharide biosynthesis protein [Erysipelothrix larvae]|uniref:Exopolysaccharide biosynthesis protein n=1 Tax=Erysipelothrix larvae TaxID=1514105 RepID=A0A0X8H0W6_9FIRM|nr:DUF4422 domain-containing protein [Erysipelothrix larvae]AMC94012.1 exopolysaccharide biosynthesis protein [Erysipelothrix larvae]